MLAFGRVGEAACARGDARAGGNELKRWLTIIVGIAGVILSTATGANASATFDPQTRTGFISRGEVIASAGKDAVVPDAMVFYSSTQSFTETCTWPDGSTVQASGTHQFYLLFHAETRYAPGSGTITGYAFSPSDIVDGGTPPPGQDLALCWQALGLPDDGTPVTQTYQSGPSTSTLSFNGVVLPFVAAGSSSSAPPAGGSNEQVGADAPPPPTGDTAPPQTGDPAPLQTGHRHVSPRPVAE